MPFVLEIRGHLSANIGSQTVLLDFLSLCSINKMVSALYSEQKTTLINQ